jgi:hypothetical protein
MLGRKVGHARVWLRAASRPEPGAWASGTAVEMTVKGLGGATTMALSEERFYAAEAPYPLIETRFAQDASGAQDVRRATLEQGQLVIRRQVNGAEQPIARIAASKETLDSLLATMPRDVAALRVGAKQEALLFNWQANKDDLVSVEVLSVDRVPHAGLETATATLSVRYQSLGVSAKTRVASGGVVLEMSLGPGLTMKLEEESVAKSDVRGLDVMGSGVASDRKLGDPAGVVGLTLALDAPAEFRLPNAANQRVEVIGPGKLRVTLTAGPGDAVDEASRAAALAPDQVMDSDAPAIVAQARQLTAGMADPRAKARALAKWVYDTLDKRLATHLPTASVILARKIGDCTEHTWLFVALARAVGIAARPVYGVAYVGDRYQSFGYHAWAEVELDGRWQPVDPTWGEEIADATHLRLASELHEIAAAMGGLTVRVIGAPTRR